MKRFASLIFASLLAVFALAGCSTTGGLSDGAATLAGAIMAPGNPDPDNKAYLDACVRQFEEQRKAEESQSGAITSALTSATDPATKASLVMLIAVKSMQAQPFKCAVERRRGIMETFTGDGLLSAGLQLYGINRNAIQAKRALESGDYRYGLQLQDAKDARQQITDLSKAGIEAASKEPFLIEVPAPTAP